MTQNRFIELMKNDELDLTEEEIGHGVHFCAEWDGLLIGPMNPEFDCCTCFSKAQRQELEETGQIKFPGLNP